MKACRYCQGREQVQSPREPNKTVPCPFCVDDMAGTFGIWNEGSGDWVTAKSGRPYRTDSLAGALVAARALLDDGAAGIQVREVQP